MKKILFILPALMLFVQAINAFVGGYLSYIRAAILISMIVYFFLTKKIKLDSIGKLILLFLSFTFFITFNSSNYISTFLSYISVFVSMFFYIISYNVIPTFQEFRKFKILLLVVPLLFIVSAILFSVFNLGPSAYGEFHRIHMGQGLHHNTIYTGILVVVLYFIFIKESKNRTRDTILISIMIILILLSFRRTAILFILVSHILFIIMSKKQILLKYVLPSILLMVATYPLYCDYLNNIFEARKSRVTFASGVLSESRFLEAEVITGKIFRFDDIEYSLIGMELFNSPGTYYTTKFPVSPSRRLHADYSALLHGSGLIGIVTYFLVLWAVCHKTMRYVKYKGLKDDVSIMLTILSVILVAVTFSGSILSITFRTSLFLFMGSLMRIADDTLKRANRIYKNRPLDRHNFILRNKQYLKFNNHR